MLSSIEALLLASSDALTLEQIVRVTGESHPRCFEAISCLREEYSTPRHGFAIVEVAGGYRFATKPEHFAVVGALAAEIHDSRLSPAALETLAIVAYQQPISRRRVSVIRGVNSDQVMRMLAVKGYIQPAGRDASAGSAILYRTTRLFLERLGLNGIADLPALEKYAPSLETAEAFEAALRDDA